FGRASRCVSCQRHGCRLSSSDESAGSRIAAGTLSSAAYSRHYFRSAFQRFTNIATTLTTVIPQCRRQRGIRPPNDVDYENLRVAVEKLVNLYNQLGSRYANVQHLINLGMNAWLADPLQQNTLNSVTAARHHAS